MISGCVRSVQSVHRTPAFGQRPYWLQTDRIAANIPLMVDACVIGKSHKEARVQATAA